MATFTGTSASETLDGGTGDDSIDGAAGNDTLRGLDGNDTIDGGSGNDSLAGGAGNDSIVGNSGNDSINGGDGNDSMFGGTGQDTVVSSVGDDTIDGGVITDRSNYTDLNFIQWNALTTTGIVVDMSGITGDGSVGFGTASKGGANGTDRFSNVNFLYLSNGNDSVLGSSALIFEQYYAASGNDTIDGGAMQQTLFPINANRLAYSGGNIVSPVVVDLQAGTASGGFASSQVQLVNFNQVRGSSLGDLLQGSDSPIIAEFFDPGTGGVDTIDGRGGIDGIRFDAAVAAINANLGTGVLLDDTGNTDTLISIEFAFGTAFNDTITGSSGDNSIEGRDGHDTLEGGLGNDTLSGGNGYDRAVYANASGPMVVNLTTGTSSGPDGSDTLLGMNDVLGSAFADTLTGGSFGTTLQGAAGDDRLVAGSGITLFVGGPGNDTFDGSGNSFTYYRIEGASSGVTLTVPARFNTTVGDGQGGTDTLIDVGGVFGTPFDDRFTGDADNNYMVGAGGNDTLDGGAGRDYASYEDATGAVSVNLALGTASGAGVGSDTLIGIEAVRGGFFNDTITGDALANELSADFGNDVVDGGDGDDTLRGNDGNDTLTGGAGIDWVYYDLTAFNISLNLGNATATGEGTDQLSGIENALGGSFNDSLFGSTVNNTLDGGAGHDSLRGGDGDDLLLGGTGSDSLRGDAGNDTLDGGVITDHINYTDNNLYTWSTATAPVVVDLSGITGDGSTGSGTVQDGLGGTDVVRNVFHILTGALNDSILGSTALTFESFDGGAGDDTIDGGVVTDMSFTRNGNRVVYTSAPGPVTVDLAAGTATGYGTDTLIHITQVRGSIYADLLQGSDNTGRNFTENFEGREGNDTIDGRGGNDVARYDNAPAAIVGSLVTNQVQDGYGSVDTLIGVEGLRGSDFADQLTGGNPANGTTAVGNPLTDGQERFTGEAGNDTIDGGQGYDRVEYTVATSAVVVTLGGSSPGTASDGTGGTDTLLNVEGVLGSDFNDTLTGSDAAYETFQGRGGNDSIDGRGGIDVLDFVFDELQGANVNLATGVVLDGFGGQDTVAGMEWLRGTRAFGDTLVGDAGDNRIDGHEGNDTLAGGDGRDTLVPGLGVDTVDGDTGEDVLELAGNRADYSISLVSPGVSRFARAMGGDDVTVRNVETVRFADGDVALASLLDQSLVGSSANETIDGGAGHDSIDGAAGNDTLGGLSGNDLLLGNSGNDSLDGGDGNDTLDGGAGSDTASYANATVPVQVNLATGTASGAGEDSLLSIEFVVGSAFSDTLSGDLQSNVLSGLAGSDLLVGAAGSDQLDGGAGNDTLDGSAPATFNRITDVNAVSYQSSPSAVVVDLSGITGRGTTGSGTASDGLGGTDTLLNIQRVLGSASADTLIGSASLQEETFHPRAGDDSIDGGALSDPLNRNGNRINFGTSSQPVSVDLANGTASGEGNDRFFNINLLVATRFDDTVLGSDRSDVWEEFAGDAGNDRIDGRGGVDILLMDRGASNTTGAIVNLATGVVSDGQGGTDTVFNIEGVRGTILGDQLTGSNSSIVPEYFTGQAGNDTIDGGPGPDVALYNRATAGITVVLGEGNNPGTAADGDGGTDTLLRIEAIWGSMFDDSITGSGGGSETLEGNAGNDTLDGGSGSGTDEASYEHAYDHGAVVNLGLGVATDDGFGSSDVLRDVENLTGTLLFGDNLTGSTGNNSLRGLGGNDTLAGAAGNDTLAPGTGIDAVDGGTGDDVLELTGPRSAYTVERVDASQLRLTLTAGGQDVRFTGIEQVAFSDGTISLAQLLPADQPTAGNDPLTGTGEVDRLDGGAGNDTLLGLTGSDVLIGGSGSDTLDGGIEGDGSAGYDVASYAGALAVQLDLRTGTATQGTDIDTLISIEAIFGSDAADTFRGADGVATRRGDTLRGGGGNDTIDGGTGVDTAEWLGARADYVVTQLNATTWTVQDVNLANGDEGTDTVTNIERFVFADQMLSFGTRAEDIARVAIVLWSPAIVSSTTLFSRGYSFYDVGYTYAQMSQVALQFWGELSDEALAAQLVANSGTSKTAAQLLATLAANGGAGSTSGRAAMVREAADDPATLAKLEQTGVKVTGIVSDHFVPDFGTLFGLLPG